MTVDSKNNPFKLEYFTILENVEKRLISLVDDFAKEEKLSEDEKEELRKLIRLAVQKRKSNYLFKIQLNKIAEGITTVFNLSIENVSDQNKNIYNKDLFYVKNTKHTVTYE